MRAAIALVLLAACSPSIAPGSYAVRPRGAVPRGPGVQRARRDLRHRGHRGAVLLRLRRRRCRAQRYLRHRVDPARRRRVRDAAGAGLRLRQRHGQRGLVRGAREGYVHGGTDRGPRRVPDRVRAAGRRDQGGRWQHRRDRHRLCGHERRIRRSLHVREGRRRGGRSATRCTSCAPGSRTAAASARTTATRRPSSSRRPTENGVASLGVTELSWNWLAAPYLACAIVDARGRGGCARSCAAIA